MIQDTNARGMAADAKFFEGYSRFMEGETQSLQEIIAGKMQEITPHYESWDESVARVMDMHRTKYAKKMTPTLAEDIDFVERMYKKKLMLGAQRALQFGGEQLFKHNIRMYNCVSSYADRSAFFGEAMYMLLCGAGVGFSVQRHHIAKLPKIVQRDVSKSAVFQVPDSIEGWSKAIDVLLSSYFVHGGKHPEYAGKHLSLIHI